nr:kinesin-like protein KIN-4C [Tanacetum cinerariifolium]
MDKTDGSQSVRVAVNVRPLVTPELLVGCSDCIIVTPGEPQVQIGSHSFTFDYVYGSTAGSTSSRIFDDCVAPLSRDQNFHSNSNSKHRPFIFHFINPNPPTTLPLSLNSNPHTLNTPSKTHTFQNPNGFESASKMDKTDGSQSVRVAVNVRPLVTPELLVGCSDCIIVTPGEPQVQIGSHSFTFDYVYGSTAGSTSSRIFDDCVAPLVDALFHGYNATVLAYGQVVVVFVIRGCLFRLILCKLISKRMDVV